MLHFNQDLADTNVIFHIQVDIYVNVNLNYKIINTLLSVVYVLSAEIDEQMILGLVGQALAQS